MVPIIPNDASLVKRDITHTEARLVTDEEMNAHAKLWPNPSKGQFNVSFTDLKQAAIVRIYRIDGTLIGKEEKVTPGTIKTFSITTKGTYIVKAVDALTGEPVLVKPLVIE